MTSKLGFCIFLLYYKPTHQYYGPEDDLPYLPEIQKEHDPTHFNPRPTRYLNGTTYMIPNAHDTPDFRISEPPFTILHENFYYEEERPYRISPYAKMTYVYNSYSRGKKTWLTGFHPDKPENLGCYCTTVYKRLTVLAGCAVITTRHILTSATATELVLKEHRHAHTLENILGAWYDHNMDMYNSSLYMTPARIHYHPRYLRPHQVNVTHPLPVVYDFAVWAATYRFFINFFRLPFQEALVCYRGSSGRFEYSSSTPKFRELALIVGFQFMKAWKRVPMPWFKYVIRTRRHWPICPKTDWGWYHCVLAYWATYGIELGAAWHRALEGYSWRYDGLIGMSAFTMKLRSKDIVGYFAPVDTWPVLNFLYSAYMGWQQCEYLDWRFYNTSGRAPIPKPWFWIPWDYTLGEEKFRGYKLPSY